MQRSKLRRLLRDCSGRVERDADLLGRLLQAPSADAHEHLGSTPQRLLDDTLEALIDQIVGMAAKTPVLLLVEDAHWVDPTSLGLLARLACRLRSVRVLLIVTHRTSFAAQGGGDEFAATLALERIGVEDSQAIVRHFAQRELAPAVVEAADANEPPCIEWRVDAGSAPQALRCVWHCHARRLGHAPVFETRACP